MRAVRSEQSPCRSARRPCWKAVGSQLAPTSTQTELTGQQAGRTLDEWASAGAGGVVPQHQPQLAGLLGGGGQADVGIDVVCGSSSRRGQQGGPGLETEQPGAQGSASCSEQVSCMQKGCYIASCTWCAGERSQMLMPPISSIAWFTKRSHFLARPSSGGGAAAAPTTSAADTNTSSAAPAWAARCPCSGGGNSKVMSNPKPPTSHPNLSAQSPAGCRQPTHRCRRRRRQRVDAGEIAVGQQPLQGLCGHDAVRPPKLCRPRAVNGRVGQRVTCTPAAAAAVGRGRRGRTCVRSGPTVEKSQ